MSRALLGLLTLTFTNSNLNANNYSSAAIGIQTFPTIDTIFQPIEKIAPLMFRGQLTKLHTVGNSLPQRPANL